MVRTLFLSALAALLASDVMADAGRFDAFERTIPELQAAMASGQTTSEELVRQYLERIATFDEAGPALNAILIINPRAVDEAIAMDRERAENGPRGPLHGIPVLLKDNYDTVDMPTTAASVAMAGFVPPDDAYQVRKLREAGAVFIGKTNLHEFARGIETVSSLGGYTRNPYDPRRNPGGSSGGTAAAVAANFAAVGMGSDTCGSIRIPAANNNLVGLRVTQGLSSRDGIIPLSHTQDVGGPIARSVIDLATVLDATVGEDPADMQTAGADAHVPASYLDSLAAEALEGARLGLLTAYLRTESPYGTVSKVIRNAIATMQDSGAEVVELEIEGLAELLRDTSVIDYEFTTDVEAYLRASGAPIRSIPELLESGQYHEALEGRYRRSVSRAADTEEHGARLGRRIELRRLLIETLDAHKLDALVYPSLRVEPVFIGEPQHGSLCRISAHSGLPALSVPAGFTPDGLPVGLELLARPFEDARLIALAYAWEQAAEPRRPPPRTPSLIGDVLTYEFEINAPSMNGKLRLDRPSQVLHYQIEAPDLDGDDVVDIKLHRGSNGPVVALLGDELAGSAPFPNGELAKLLGDELYLAIYTKRLPKGVVRGRIERR
jgi:Asp-tRNA(Asn)/Glu-tRNA(Gln) amidotransferase A subunit family amidase